jgi:hypothetical protein
MDGGAVKCEPARLLQALCAATRQGTLELAREAGPLALRGHIAREPSAGAVKALPRIPPLEP